MKKYISGELRDVSLNGNYSRLSCYNDIRTFSDTLKLLTSLPEYNYSLMPHTIISNTRTYEEILDRRVNERKRNKSKIS